jgi:hypothetical protein
MAAGLGFKNFTTGEVLTSADVNGYLMQGVLVFATATARDAAITSPQEGQFAYLKDTNVTTYYTGSAWANVDTTGMTNPMTTTADMIYSSSGSTPARLGIGTAGQVLTVNSGATAPEWATPAGGGGGKVLQVVQASTTTSQTIASTSYQDTNLTAIITPTSATSTILVMVSQFGYQSRNSTSINSSLQIVRGVTSIYDADFAARLTATGATAVLLGVYTNLIYEDSPATTSATTYKTQGKVSSTADNGQIIYQDNSAPSTITLLEIGA